MKKITIIALMLLAGLKMEAQTSFEASGNYAKLYDITYDATVQNKLYAVSLSNHIVVSLNNGVDWDVLYSSTTLISNLKLTPGNEALSFIAQDGLHFFNLSTNQVTNSYEIPANNVDGAGASYLVGYDVYDAAGTTIVVNTQFSVGLDTQGKTFYTSDSGATWNEIYYTVLNDNVFIQDAAIAPNNPRTIYLTRGNGNTDIDGGLFITKDAGVTWSEKLSGIILGPITFRPSNFNEILIGTGVSFGQVPENLYKSIDAGENWDVVAITWNEGILNNINKIVYNPINEDKIIILEENEIVRTNDGGLTWINTVYGPEDLNYSFGLSASYNPFNENQVTIGTDYYPQISNDGGGTLSQIIVPYCPTTAVSIAKYGNNTHLYYNNQGGYSHKDYTTGVLTPYAILAPTVFSDAKFVTVADPVVAGRVYNLNSSDFMGGNLTVSTDYGVTNTIVLGTFSSDIQEVTVDPNNSNIVYVVLRSTDNSTVYKIDLTDLNAITNEEIVTPDTAAEEGLPGGVVSGLLISSADSNNITIAKATTIYHSTDGGWTWTEVETTGLDLSENDIIWDMVKSPSDENHYMLTTNIGVYSSIDAGITWTSVLPGVNARKLKYSNLDNNVVAAAVYSGPSVQAELFYTINNGESWTEISPEQIKNIFTGSADFIFTEDTIEAYFATSDLGVMKHVTDLSTLGINNPVVNPAAGIIIYPNPTAGVLNITANQNFDLKNTVIYTVTGQKVFESSKNNLDLSSLSKGVYIVKAELMDGTSISQKLIKK